MEMGVGHYPEDVARDESVYSMEALLDLLENDEITAEEHGFMNGYIDEIEIFVNRGNNRYSHGIALRDR
jgi:hypothetical protein